MSLRNKSKSSAFSVFKGRKATSMTDVESAAKSPKMSLKKSTSTTTTPTGSLASTTSTSSGVSSIFGKISQASERKKQKAELKKVKKSMKSSGKTRPSYIPDSAINSPLIGQLSNGGSVELKSLRPKGSMANIRYQLPLKATPDVPVRNASASVEITPDIVPKPRQNSSQSLNAVASKKRINSQPEFTPPTELPARIQRAASQRSNKEEPPRPPKRRRISQGSSTPSSPTQMNMSQRSAVLSPEGARERTEPMPSHPSDRDTGVPYMYDSVWEAKRLFECLIHPVKPNKFFSELWEKKPLLVKRHMPTYNGGWFSTEEFDKILKEENLAFGTNIDVVTYTNGKRETHNPAGRAHGPVVWDHYQNGCSVRLLNPQTYSRNVWKLLSILQEYFSCMVGANVYLTPPGTQGFAPHYDDIEAFILQLEGKKHWRLYSPRSENEYLPRYSSSNFTDKDIGEPILDVILEAGDLLYFPKGTIHQGRTLEDAHSLHLTVSCEQLNSWGDLLERVVPRALQLAIEEDVEFRKSLPRDYLHFMGVAFSDSVSGERTSFLRHIEQLMRKVVSYSPVDAACDQMAVRFQHDSLPPVLSETEKACSIHGNGEYWDSREGRVRGATELDPDTTIKIIRKGAVRLVTEGEDKVCIYHNLENARVYHGNDVQWIEISAEAAPAVEHLLQAYPKYVSVESLPLDTLQEKIDIASLLYDKGFLVTATPLIPDTDDSSASEGSDHE